MACSHAACLKPLPVKVLVAENDEKVGHFVAQLLRDDGHIVEECWTGAGALRLSRLGAYSLLILDSALSDPDGFAVSREVRQLGIHTPILMLGTATDVSDRVRGLESGADDFLVEPFAVPEFLARVHALLRRQGTPGRFVCGALEVDCTEALALLGGRRLHCTARELAILAHLARRREQVVTRAELLAEVWDDAYEGGTKAIDVHVCHLRASLGDHAWMIETVRGKGYRLRARRDNTPE